MSFRHWKWFADKIPENKVSLVNQQAEKLLEDAKLKNPLIFMHLRTKIRVDRNWVPYQEDLDKYGFSVVDFRVPTPEDCYIGYLHGQNVPPDYRGWYVCFGPLKKDIELDTSIMGGNRFILKYMNYPTTKDGWVS